MKTRYLFIVFSLFCIFAVYGQAPPQVTIIQPINNAVFDGEQVKVDYFVSGTAPKSARVLVDDRPAQLLTDVKLGQNTVMVDVLARNCKISIIARNEFGESLPANVNLTWNGRIFKPTLYILAVGVSNYSDPDLQLQFAAKDAIDFLETMFLQKGLLYEDVVIKMLTDRQASSENIRDGLYWLQTETTQRDVAMLYMAGHGINNAANSYFFMPVNADPNRINATCVSWTEITETINVIAGKRILFMDACFSGNVLGNNRQRSTLNQAIYNLTGADNGAVVFTSSTSRQTSLENPEWNNGAFTKALVEGLKGKADPYNSKIITVKSLDLYITNRVKELTNGQQAPTTIIPSSVPDFPLAVVAEKPTLTTNSVTTFTTSTALLGGNITNAGTPLYTERGVVYATMQNPTTAHNKTVITGAETGNFSVNMTGLTDNTTYYVRAYATNTEGTAYGAQESFTTKQIIPVITISAQPAVTTNVTAGSITGYLTVSENVTQNATLSYQWYSATTNSNTGGTLISGATSAIFTIPVTLTAGTYYYFCEIHATGGASFVRSNVATVNVQTAAKVQTPAQPAIVINAQPAATTNVTAGSITGNLTVSANVTQGATLSYQWYISTTNSNTGGTAMAIMDATSASYAIPTKHTTGTYYYFCEVRATNGATSVRSNVATVNVASPATVPQKEQEKKEKPVKSYPPFYIAVTPGLSEFGTYSAGEIKSGGTYLIGTDIAYFFTQNFGAGIKINVGNCYVRENDESLFFFSYHELMIFAGTALYCRLGNKWRNDGWAFTAGAGIGALNWKLLDVYDEKWDENESYTSAGAFLSAGVNYMFTKHFGIGLNVQSVFGTIKDQYGWERKPAGIGGTFGINFRF